jgi:hypothetical protein
VAGVLVVVVLGVVVLRSCTSPGPAEITLDADSSRADIDRALPRIREKCDVSTLEEFLVGSTPYVKILSSDDISAASSEFRLPPLAYYDCDRHVLTTEPPR